MIGTKKQIFRAALVVFFLLNTLTIIGLALEITERRKYASATETFAAERNQVNTVANEKQESLWKVPWFSYLPNTELESQGQIIRINSLGFRAPEYEVPKPAGTYRIICIGGSTTAGGKTNDLTYPVGVQVLLRDRLKTDKIEVLNCGISGLNSAGQIEKLPVYLQQDPDMVIEYCGVNDICWRLFRRWKADANPARKLARHSLYLTNHYNSMVMPPKEQIERDLDSLVMENLATIHETFKKAGVEMILCTFAYPDLGQCSGEERVFFDYDLKTVWRGSFLTIESYCEIMKMYNRKLEDFGRKHSLLVIPLASKLSGGRNMFNDICHMKFYGMVAKANIIRDYLAPRVAPRLVPVPEP